MWVVNTTDHNTYKSLEAKFKTAVIQWLAYEDKKQSLNEIISRELELYEQDVLK